MIYIGIDPDVEKSGVAEYSKKLGINLVNFNYFELLAFFESLPISKTLIVIEKGEQNKSLFNAENVYKKTKGVHQKKLRASLKAASSIGRNFEVTNIIEQMCKRLGLTYEFYIPTKSMPKFSHKWAVLQFKLTQKKSNEEQRDALRCIMKYIL